MSGRDRERGRKGGRRGWARKQGRAEGIWGHVLYSALQITHPWKTEWGSLILPIGQVRTPGPILCVVMGTGDLAMVETDKVPASVVFTVW